MKNNDTAVKPLKIKISPNGGNLSVKLVDGGNSVEITFTPVERDLWRDRIELFLSDDRKLLDYKAICITRRNKLK